jgi:UPF0755 protein
MFKKLFFCIVIVGFLLVAHIAVFLFRPAFSYGSLEKKEVRINDGSSLKIVADLLMERQLILNSIYFRMLGRWAGNDLKIKPGMYTLHTAMKPLEILELIVAGQIFQSEVTLREGLTSKQIGRILEREHIVAAQAFLDAVRDPVLLSEMEIEAENFEGYLFPSTYEFSKESEPGDVIRQMVQEFRNQYSAGWERRSDHLGMTQHEVVTLASIINKEISASREAPLVSAVFHNRLKIGMRLQSDPTVIFGIKNFNGNLTLEDLRTYTPYNTYRINGLPPGPISNPGKVALQSALFPDDVDYLYFVSMNNGTHRFSRTLEEHNSAVNKFQRGL